MACLHFFSVLFSSFDVENWGEGGLSLRLIDWVNYNTGCHGVCKVLVVKSLQNIEYGVVSFNSQEEGCLQRL